MVKLCLRGQGIKRSDKYEEHFWTGALPQLGFSLGVDIIPYKTCSFDCIYCELGRTDCKTIEPVEVIQRTTF